MMGKFFDRFSTRTILEFLAVGGLLTAAIVAPNAVQIFKFLLKDKNHISWGKFNQSAARQYLGRLEKRALIKRERRGRQIIICLTEKGRAELKKYGVDKIELKKDKQWDGKWRVIIFDIPEFKKQARDALRRKFKSLGMLQLQKSVFVYPFECKKEIDIISDFFGVGENIFYLESQVDDIEKKLLDFFKIF